MEPRIGSAASWLGTLRQPPSGMYSTSHPLWLKDDDDKSHLLPRGRVTTRQSGEPRVT